MDDQEIKRELARLAHDAIPFRATGSHIHHTWARTFHSRPELTLRPHSVAELQKIVTLARRCRRRLCVVGCGHSPSDLTCTSAWLVNLDALDAVLAVEPETRVVTVQAGIRLHALNRAAQAHGLTMPNLGSIDVQSIAGAIATATHGSSLRHGLLSESVRGLRLVLANGRLVRCSPTQNEDLFRAALVSLGALGIIVEVDFEMVPAANISWTQSIWPLTHVLERWDKDLWTRDEFTRVWWLPYLRRMVVWRAGKTDAPPGPPPKANWALGRVGYHLYQFLLWLSCFAPSLTPWVERAVYGLQFGFKAPRVIAQAVQDQHSGLVMDCLYLQYVNEWALPLHKGPEAILRLDAWIRGDNHVARIPGESHGLPIHSPIEVRVSDSTAKKTTRPFLDPTQDSGPTLYLNAIMYRPYGRDPPGRKEYYDAFEYLMKDMGARPHWAKNFQTVTNDDLKAMYGRDLDAWVAKRNEVDPEGMFVGDWHRRNLLGSTQTARRRPLEEWNSSLKQARRGGLLWFGEIQGDGIYVDDQEMLYGGEKHGSGVATGREVGSRSSDESFDVMQRAEAANNLYETDNE